MFTVPFRVSAQTIPPPISPPQLELLEFASGFSKPVDIAHAGDERLFIVEQDGLIRILQPDGSVIGTPFLDIDDRVRSINSEQGLLGLAFSPDYVTDRLFYVNYTGNDGHTRISRFQTSPDPNIADESSEEILMTIIQPFSNHNGGCLKFGPDGMLYIGTGDGGSGGDPGDRSQTPTNLLGKMLRVDVSEPGAYTIPPDNPFVGIPDTLAEIWHMGLRNPWRYSFDRTLGDLWISDVGQNAFEEINLQRASSGGGENWGWRCYEGNAPYNTADCSPAAAYDAPVFTYAHPSGFSVTGGFVYRGMEDYNLQGHYLLADYVTGRWWTIQRDSCQGLWAVHPLGVLRTLVSSFGENAAGELFCSILGSGQIFRISEKCSDITYTIGQRYEGSDSTQYWVEGNPDAVVEWFLVDTSMAITPAICNPVEVFMVNDSIIQVEDCETCLLYARISSDDGCVVHTRTVVPGAVLSAVPPLSGSASWTIYPQPASTSLVLEGLSKVASGQFALHDSQGRKVDSRRHEQGVERIEWDVRSLSPGTYHVIWYGDEGSYASKTVLINR